MENYTKTIFVTDWIWNDATEHGWEIVDDLPAEEIERLRQMFNETNECLKSSYTATCVIVIALDVFYF
jgi:hypothetical protein